MQTPRDRSFYIWTYGTWAVTLGACNEGWIDVGVHGSGKAAKEGALYAQLRYWRDTLTRLMVPDAKQRTMQHSHLDLYVVTLPATVAVRTVEAQVFKDRNVTTIREKWNATTAFCNHGRSLLLNGMCQLFCQITSIRLSTRTGSIQPIFCAGSKHQNKARRLTFVLVEDNYAPRPFQGTGGTNITSPVVARTKRFRWPCCCGPEHYMAARSSWGNCYWGVTAFHSFK